MGTETQSSAAAEYDISWKSVYFKGERLMSEPAHNQVEDKIFFVPKHGFEEASEVFASMFLLPNAGQVEGESRENPIVLEGYQKADFGALLRVLYPRSTDIISKKFTLSKDEWIGVLRLSTVWEMQEIRQFSIENLSETTPSLTDRQKVSLSRQHKVAKWLLEGLVSLASRTEEKTISGEELEACVGLHDAYKLTTLVLRLPDTSQLELPTPGSQSCNIGSIFCPLCDRRFFDLGPCSHCKRELLHSGVPNVTFKGSVNMERWSRTGEMEGRSDQEFLHCSACLKHPRAGSLLCGHCRKRPDGDEVRIRYHATYTMECAVERLFCERVQAYTLTTINQSVYSDKD